MDVRIALIGFGRFGANHAQAISTADGAVLAGIATRSESSANAARAQFPGVRVTQDYRELIAGDGVDAVDVALPTYLHYEVAKAALEAGKHVMVEKPMTPTVAECRELARIADRRGLVLAVGFKRRVARIWSRVKELVDEGVIGDPRFALFELWRRPYRLGADGWRYDINRVGSWELEEPVHCFDLARWLFGPKAGRIVTAYAGASAHRSDQPELHDDFSAILTFENGAHATIAQSLAGWGHHHGLKLTGVDGALWATWHGASDDAPPIQTIEYLRHGSGGNEPQRLVIEPTSETFELMREITSFVGAIRDGSPLHANATDGIWSIAVCEAVQASLESGRRVSLEEFGL